VKSTEDTAVTYLVPKIQKLSHKSLNPVTIVAADTPLLKQVCSTYVVKSGLKILMANQREIYKNPAVFPAFLFAAYKAYKDSYSSSP